MTPQELKNSILQLAIQGKLVEQRPEEGTAEELYRRIQEEKKRLIKEGKIKKEKPLPEISEGEVPFEVPESWMWVRLGTIISISSGDGLTSKEMDESGAYPVYGGNGVNGHHNAYNITKRTLVIGRVGFYCGSTHITEGKAWVTDNAFITTFDEDRIDMKWLKCYIDYLNPRKKASSTAQPVISGKLIYPMLVSLPPLAEQKRIVTKIEEILPYIDRYEQAWSRLEGFNKQLPVDMQKSLLQWAIQGKLVEQRPEEGTAEELYRKIQEEKRRLVKEGKVKKEKPLPEIAENEMPFEIPESWKWVRLIDLCKSITDGDHQPPPQVPNGIPFLVISNVSSGMIDFSSTRYVPNNYFRALSSERIAEQGDILFTVTGSYGIPVKVDCSQEFCFQRHIALLKLLIEWDYIYYLLKSPIIKSQCDAVATGTAQKTVGLKSLREMILPLPPLAEQKRIVAKLEELLPLCEKLKAP